ncbi:hypothetical protein DL96DRAFT_1596979 [Flagelloscypha sp. PMI_526]|nr:hypothetical protein DL96DRAFT_1596979 [Flagelloscypha sp. PMI_526]
MATIPPPLFPTSPIIETHGPGLVGVLLNVMLYGTQIVQTFTYFDTYHRDPVWMKVFVGVLFLADTLNAMFSAGWIFKLMIIEFSNLQAYLNADWLLSADPAMGGLIAAACQGFFAWRLYILTGSWLVGAFVALLACCVAVGGVGIGIGLGITPDLTNIEHFRPWVFVWLLPGLICDVTITITMTYYLRTARQRTAGFKRTETILRKVVALTIQNCLLTTLCAAGDLISYLTTPKGYHIGFSFPIPKLYSNAVMTSLNSRARLKNMTSAWETYHDNSMDSSGESGQRRPNEVYNLSTSQPQVFVETSVVTDAKVGSIKRDL